MFRLTQDDNDFDHEIERSLLHIRESSILEIYVPQNKERQDLCFFDNLPRQLLQMMMKESAAKHTTPISEASSRIFNKIFNAPEVIVPSILDSEGIINVDLPEEEAHVYADAVEELPDQPASDEDTPNPEASHAHTSPLTEDNESEDGSSTNSSKASRSLSPEPTLVAEVEFQAAESAFASSRPPQVPTHVSNSRQVQNEGGINFSAPPTANTAFINPFSNLQHRSGPNSGHHENQSGITRAPNSDLNAQDLNTSAGYLQILNNVISAAERMSLPSFGAYDMSDLLSNLPTEEENDPEAPIILHSRVPLERDMKIGAAGELFVFEILSRLEPSLPEFSAENWRSTIRKYTTVHPKYTFMPPWKGKETADIVYFDQTRTLTEALIDKGYLKRESWVEKTPEYLIEVKSTTGPLHRPFYMSKRQYQRIQECSNPSSSPLQAPQIYMVVRVFNVNQADVDLRIYLDPYTWRKDDKELVFTAETWSVVPGKAKDSS
ncbi:hypothetical protein G7Z17_g10511 [Cylindrodendrum hubeiense]|uniref:Protein NO VEIN C-terminal domain-containing protein n=1 Tax=Cylindrodendrum hubeiense TaxID=595255 RepID=A0A9P5H2K0_9HYPO|nr:hypothetical protein G7Z17_g10511 [Cylindrodendrum hubeiense]